MGTGRTTEGTEAGSGACAAAVRPGKVLPEAFFQDAERLHFGRTPVHLDLSDG